MAACVQAHFPVVNNEFTTACFTNIFLYDLFWCLLQHLLGLSLVCILTHLHNRVSKICLKLIFSNDLILFVSASKAPVSMFTFLARKC